MTFDPNRSADPAPLTPSGPEQWAAPSAPLPAMTEPSTGTPPVPTTPVVASMPAPALSAGARSSRNARSGGLLNIMLVLAAAVAIGGVAFAVGRSSAPAPAVIGTGRGNVGGVVGPDGSFVPGANGQPGLGRGGLAGGGLTLRGTVESVNGNTLTIKTATGQTVEVTTGATTTYSTKSPASASDVQAGATVEVQLELDGKGRPSASDSPSGALGTAGNVTVIP